MQLISFEKSYFLSSEYHKIPSLISQFECETEIYTIQVEEIIEEFSKRAEISIFLKFQEDIKLLKAIYTFENFTDVKEFIWSHRYLIDILFEAHKQIKKIFGEVVNLCLELHHDPEEDFEELFVIIKSHYAPQKARELMNDLDRTWFLDIMDKTQGNLCITEEPL